MAFYEHTFVGKQDLSDKEIDNLVSKYSDIIKKSGKILKIEKWGLLNLATKIKRNRKGIFIHFKFEGKNKIVKDIEEKLSIENNIIRYLTVKYNKLDLNKEYFNFKKKNKFVVYQGSHGDKGAEIADIILPGAAYTEKNGLFINLEGKLQSAYKASYPPGEAREDWLIFKDLAHMMKKSLGYNNVNNLRESINHHIQSKIKNGFKKTIKVDFTEENISVKHIDYYYTNSIARSSKVMSECRQISKNFLFKGIEKAN